jgi:hypothetical protein
VPRRRSLSKNPFGFVNPPGRRDPIVEEYQIALLCDNFFLLGVTSETTLGNVPHENVMRGRSAWKIENYTYRECPHPDREFGYAVSLHNHSCHSVEKLAALNQVVKLAFMRPFSGVLQKSFGLGGVPDLNYAEITFNPPYTPDDVYQMEAAAAANWGFHGVHLAITDHDEFAGSLALLRGRPDLNGRIAVSEELSLWFQGHLFHLGVSRMPESEVEETHTRIQAAARSRRYDELFETLAASGCLVTLNHPLVAWEPGAETIPVTELLSRYGWAIDALEVNGMRPREENTRVLWSVGETAICSSPVPFSPCRGRQLSKTLSPK